jgi:hypothetical protein
MSQERQAQQETSFCVGLKEMLTGTQLQVRTAPLSVRGGNPITNL